MFLNESGSAYVTAGDVDGRLGGVLGLHVEDLQFSLGLGGHQETRRPDDTLVTGHNATYHHPNTLIP